MLEEYLPQVSPQESQQFSSRILSFPQKESIARTYTMDFDEIEAREVKSAEEQERFSSYKLMNMETHLGERFNVNLSNYSYDIKYGLLWGKDMEEPAIDSFKKGRDYRRKEGNSIDFDREDAEIEGLKKIQAILIDPNTSIGTIMLSISPPGLEGSAYEHRFHDMFILKETNSGKRYVECRRYASGLEVEDYQEQLMPIKKIEVDWKDPGASLLANPVEIPNIFSPDGIHEYLHKDKGNLNEATFNLIKKKCQPLAAKYIDSLLKDPSNRREHAIWFNAYLNKADAVLEDIEVNGIVAVEKISQINTQRNIEEDRARYGYQEVRSVMTGCGSSGGYELGKEMINSPFSISDFAKDKHGERTFTCPSCKKENLRPMNELLPRCLHCNSADVAC